MRIKQLAVAILLAFLAQTADAATVTKTLRQERAGLYTAEVR